MSEDNPEVVRATVAELDAATARILELKESIGRKCHELGSELARVRLHALWEARGYASFEDYLAMAVSIGRSQAYKFIRIAQSVPRAIATRLGPEKVDAVIRYVKATPRPERATDLAKLRIRVGTRNKTLAEATVDEIKKATAFARRAAFPDRARPGAREARELVARANEALARAKLSRVKLVVTWDKGARGYVVAIRGVEVASAWRVLSLLANAAEEP